jgi:ketopantoate reductase
MLQDVRKKKRTEIDYINGAIVKEGRKKGIETPINRMLTLLIKEKISAAINGGNQNQNENRCGAENKD